MTQSFFIYTCLILSFSIFSANEEASFRVSENLKTIATLQTNEHGKIKAINALQKLAGQTSHETSEREINLFFERIMANLVKNNIYSTKTEEYLEHLREFSSIQKDKIHKFLMAKYTEEKDKDKQISAFFLLVKLQKSYPNPSLYEFILTKTLELSKTKIRAYVDEINFYKLLGTHGKQLNFPEILKVFITLLKEKIENPLNSEMLWKSERQNKYASFFAACNSLAKIAFNPITTKDQQKEIKKLLVSNKNKYLELFASFYNEKLNSDFFIALIKSHLDNSNSTISEESLSLFIFLCKSCIKLSSWDLDTKFFNTKEKMLLSAIDSFWKQLNKRQQNDLVLKLRAMKSINPKTYLYVCFLLKHTNNQELELEVLEMLPHFISSLNKDDSKSFRPLIHFIQHVDNISILTSLQKIINSKGLLNQYFAPYLEKIYMKTQIVLNPDFVLKTLHEGLKDQGKRYPMNWNKRQLACLFLARFASYFKDSNDFKEIAQKLISSLKYGNEKLFDAHLNNPTLLALTSLIEAELIEKEELL